MILPRRATQAAATPGIGAPGGVVVPGNFAAQQTQQVGRALQGAGAAAFDVASQLQDEYNTSRIKEADTRAAETIRDHVGKYTRLLGKDAHLKKEQVFADLQKSLEQIGKPLDTDDQRDMYQQLVSSRMVGARGAADAHEAEQIKIDAVGQAKARQESERLDAIGAAGDPRRFTLHKQVMLGEVDNLADIAGLAQDDPRRTLAKREAASKTHNDAVRALIDQNRVSAAQAHLAAAGDEVDPVTHAQLTNLIDRATVSDQSLRLQFDVMDGMDAKIQERIRSDWQATGGAVPRPPTQADKAAAWSWAFDEVDTMFRDGKISADVRDATVNRLTGEERRRVQEDAVQARRTMGMAEQWLVDNPLLGVDAMPPALHQSVREQNLLGDLNGFAISRRYVTQPAAYAEAMSIPSDMLRRTSPDVLFSRFRGRLDDGDLRLLQARHAAAMGQETVEQTHLISVDDLIKEAGAQAKLLNRRGQETEDELARFHRFRQAAEERIQTFERDELGGQRKATRDEVKKLIAEEQLNEAQVVHWWSDTRKPVGSMSPDERETAYVTVGTRKVRIGAVPPGQRSLIVQALRRRGQLATDEAITAAWVAGGERQDTR